MAASVTPFTPQTDPRPNPQRTVGHPAPRHPNSVINIEIYVHKTILLNKTKRIRCDINSFHTSSSPPCDRLLHNSK